jgi:hypothetical protein
MEHLTAWIAGGRGRLTDLATACGITHSAVYQWKKVPAEHARKVSEFTGIPLDQLRPDLFEGMEKAS